MTEDEQSLRRRTDMCGVLTVESLMGTALNDDSFQVPRWVWDSRIKYVQETSKNEHPDDKKELGWLNSTLSQLRNEVKSPALSGLKLQQVKSVADIEQKLKRGEEVIVFGRTADGRKPHMFHLGSRIQDAMGDRFTSLQQVTRTVDLADFFMRQGSCNVVTTKIQRKQ